jgi:hypothetical protein
VIDQSSSVIFVSMVDSLIAGHASIRRKGDLGLPLPCARPIPSTGPNLTRENSTQVANMSNSLLTLGPYSFVGLEVPERISLKAKQRIMVHHLASGPSVIDSLGKDYEIICFRGIFSGVNTAARIRSIEDLKSQGTPVPLTWGSKSLLVIIQRFDLNYSSIQWVSYQLTCFVTNDLNSASSTGVNDLFGSPNIQVSDFFNILQNTYLAPTSDQASAILRLATLDYDVVPPAALHLATEFLESIDKELESFYSIPVSNQTGVLESLEEQLISLTQLTSRSGGLAALLLARNRLADISVSAICVSQQ